MGEFDKKKAFGVGGVLTGAAAIIAVLANISEIAQLFDRDNKQDKPEKSVAVVETIDKDVEETVIEQPEVIEAVEVTEAYVVEESEIKEEIVEQAEIIEESVIVPEEVIEPETEPPTEPKPISIYVNDLQYMSCKNDVLTQTKLTDNIGNEYHTGMFIASGWQFKADGGSANYYIQGKYKTFSGTVAVPSGYESKDYYSACFQIYGDDNLLYSSPVMTNTSFPESFSIDITDVQMLTISYPDSIDGCGDMATIYDGLLSS